MLVVAMIAFSAPQNAAVLQGAWLYNGDQIRKPYYAIEEVYFCVLYIIYRQNLTIFFIQNELFAISFLFCVGERSMERIDNKVINVWWNIGMKT